MISKLNFRYNSLDIFSDFFNGPLDVLLDLIKSKKKDITEISLAEICQPFLDFVNKRKSINLNLDCEFIEIASTLILIKSRALLPTLDTFDDFDSQLDPETELKEKLIAHQEIQKLSVVLNDRNLLNREYFSRELPIEIKDKNISVDGVVVKFLSTYQEILNREYSLRPYEFNENIWDVEQRIEEIKKLLVDHDYFCYLHLSKPLLKKILITNLMAILELARTNIITIFQSDFFADIICYRTNKFNN